MKKFVELVDGQWVNVDRVLTIVQQSPDRSAVLMAGGMSVIVPMGGAQIAEALNAASQPDEIKIDIALPEAKLGGDAATWGYEKTATGPKPQSPKGGPNKLKDR